MNLCTTLLSFIQTDNLNPSQNVVRLTQGCRSRSTPHRYRRSRFFRAETANENRHIYTPSDGDLGREGRAKSGKTKRRNRSARGNFTLVGRR